jgi:hypothetical protein
MDTELPFQRADPMASAHPTFDRVREIGQTLPEVVESTIHGAASLKVRGKLLACVPVNKSAEPNCAAIRIESGQRAALLKTRPDIYYVTDHYANYPIVLIRLSRVSDDELRDLLRAAWNFVSSKRPAPNTGGRTTKKPLQQRQRRSGSRKSGARR